MREAAWAVVGVLVFGRARLVGRWEVRSEVVVVLSGVDILEVRGGGGEFGVVSMMMEWAR